MESDRQFVEILLAALLNHPEDVKVSRVVDDMGVLISVEVNKADMGILIGKAGQNVGAIRTLLRVIGAKTNSRVNLKVIEPQNLI